MIGLHHTIPPAHAGSSVQRILLIRRGGLGDFILALPVVDALRRLHPHIHLEVMGPPDMLPLAMGTGNIQAGKSSETPGLSTFYGPGDRLDPHLSAYFSTFHRVILLGADPEGRFSANLVRAGAGEVVVIPPFPPEGECTHVSDYLVSMVTGIPRADPPHVEVLENEMEDARAYLSAVMGREGASVHDGFFALAAVHPGSGGPGKVWPPERMADVVRRLVQERDVDGILIVQGPADGLYGEEVAKGLRGVPSVVVANRPLAEVAALLRCCYAFIGSDSGVAHLAAAVGVPSCVIFGPTDPLRWAPRGARVSLVYSRFPCSPCDGESMRVCGSRACLRGISAETVFGTAKKMLSSV